MATIYYIGLTSKKDSVTINLTNTIGDLIVAIAADEGLPTQYYSVSLEGSPDKSDRYYDDSTTTLTALGVVDGNVFICTPNQSGTKEDRQIQKLEIAAATRTADGNVRNVYDITRLPDTYNGNVPGADDNANVGGLLQGRPWTSYEAGLYKTTYTGYFADDVNFFATATPATAGANPATSVQTTVIEEPATDDGESFSVQWLGYFKPTTTETHTFFLNSDDASYMWIGATAVTGFATGNALINNGGGHAPQEVSGSIALTAGQYYPVRIQFGEQGGGDLLEFNYSTPTIVKTTTVTGKVFYNSATNGH